MVASLTEWKNRSTSGLADDRALSLAKATIQHFTSGLSSDWGCGGRQGMTGQVFGWLGIRNGVDFAPGGNRDRWVEPKR